MTEVTEQLPEKVEEVAKEEENTVAENPTEAKNHEAAAATDTDSQIDTSTSAHTESQIDTSTSAQERKIIRQVEYYFGDANMSRDKFLLEQISKDAEGWVPISVLLTFNRLAAICSDMNVIAEACMKAEEGLIEVNEEKTKIRRHPERPLPERNQERRKEIMSRTAYAKGFPLDSTMDAILEYFTDFEKVVHIYLRKYHDKPTKTYKFKGSVFVTFEKIEQAENFIEKAEPKYKENKLIVKWQEKYLEEKRQEQKEKNNRKREKKEKQEANKIQLPKRSVLHFEGADDGVTRELIREAVDKVKGVFDVAYIDFSKGDKTGHIRFYEEDSAQKFLEKMEEKKLKLNDDITLDIRTLSIEEEVTFLEKAVENMKNRRHHFNQKKSHHGNRHRRSGGGKDRSEEKKPKLYERTGSNEAK